MRICITLILSVLFLFLGIQAVAVDAQSSIPHPTRVVMPLSEQSSPDSHQLADTRHPHATQAVEFADAHTLAYRLSLSAQRMNRFSSLEFFSLIRQQLRKLALRLASLISSQIHSHDDASTFGWHFACEYYVYGMRRLLL